MNRIVPSVLLLMAILCGFVPTAQTQVHFFLNEADLLPPNPDSETPISVHLRGVRSNECSYLDNASVSIDNSLVTITMNWENTANTPPFNPCSNNAEVLWDSTFTIGVLDVGTYFLVFNGTNFFLTGLPNSVQFVVTDPSCVEPDGTIQVTHTGDNGSGSLRQAIICANDTPGPNTIEFALTGAGPDTIRVGESTQTALPALTDATTIIDGGTHPGFGNGTFNPKVVLDGQFTNWDSPINALWIQGDNCAVYGLGIINFPDDAIDIDQAHNVQIGAPDRGNVIHSNGSEVDFFSGAPGTGPWEGCAVVIRGNANNCRVQSNYLGTNFDQSLSPGNEYCGVLIRDGGDNHTIGGVLPGEGNVIARHGTGVRIQNGALGNRIQHNHFYCNDSVGIELLGNANLAIEAPVIVAATPIAISGTAAPNYTIEVYLNEDTDCTTAVCQGTQLLGTATVQSGNWTLLPPFANGIQLIGGQKVTALATDIGGNTSEFAICMSLVGVSDCTNDQGIIWVSNTNDTGPGSLREAINCANETPGSNQIHFNIPGDGPHTIEVGATDGAALPALLDESTIIDGSTQPGFGENNTFDPQIILDGQASEWTSPINALWIQANACAIYALTIINFPDDAIDVLEADFVQIGAPNKGNVIYGNGAAQDSFPGAPGTGPWNGCGIVIRQGADQATIQGNRIGTNYAENLSAGNEYCGIIIQDGSSNIQIGGSAPGAGNVIAYHERGIRIEANAQSCLIQQNALFCNDSLGIELLGNANGNPAVPLIDTANVSTINGEAATTALWVEVFVVETTACAGAPCQGKTFLGQASVNNGLWTLTTPFANGVTLSGGDQLTAIATDGNNNSSAFAACYELALCNVVAEIDDPIDASCGQANGSFVVTTLNGLAPFQYDIGDGPVDDPVFTGLSSGSYQVTVTDANLCSTTAMITLSDSDGPSLALLEAVNATCELPNGSIDVLATGGTAPYNYLLLGGTTDGPPFTGLAAGEYTIIVTDANACVDSQTVSLTTSPAVTLAVDEVVDAICDEANGSISVVAGGGTLPFVYYLNGQLSNSPSFSNLSGGAYNITVVDANSCIASEVVNVGNSPAPTLEIVSIQAASCDEANGGFTVSPTGGTAPFVYHFGQISTSNPVFTDLAGGIYNITVEDANGCTDEQSLIIDNTPAPLIAVSNVTSASCGNANGSITVSAAAGTPPYTYDVGMGPSIFPVFNGLPGGIYEVSVVDANACTASLTAIIGDSPAPELELLTVTHPTCGQANGSATYLGSGGTPPYIYSIGSAMFTSSIFTGVAAGIYEVTITDALGCTDVESFELTDPGIPQLNVAVQMDASCNLSNGSFAVDVFDGLTPYTFDLGAGPTTSGSFNNLAAGSYAVTVSDAVGCTNTIEVDIANVGLPTNAAFSFLADGGLVNFMNASVNGESYFWDFGDGATSVEESPGHEYLLSGDYTVCLTASNDCGDDLSCTLVSILLPLADVSIAGTIAREDGLPVAGTIVNCTGELPQTTLVDGVYEFASLPAAEDYLVQPQKNTGIGNGVNIFDIYLIQQHILATTFLDSPYKIIAADVDRGGSINILDIYFMQQVILNTINTFPNNESWRFIPQAYVFPDPLFPLGANFPESLFFPNLLSDSTNQDFVGVKVGDVDLNGNPALIAQAPDQQLHFVLEDQALAAGQVSRVAVKARNFEQLAAWQWHLHFDPEKIQWLGMENGALPGWDDTHLALSETGDLQMIWYDPTAQNNGLSLSESTTLFYLEFQAMEAIDQLSEVLALGQLANFNNMAYQVNGLGQAIDLEFETGLVATEERVKEWEVSVFPNPFASQSTIQVTTTGSEVGDLRLFDRYGRLLWQKSQMVYEQGRWVIDGQDLPGTGLYFWELSLGTQKRRGKLVFGQ
ncbi:MAG: PKD domain-containing protein [Bacteroidota bacterium]